MRLTQTGRCACKVVLIQEAEAQFITTYTVLPTRVPDQALWVPAVQTHCALFGHATRLAVADAGFASAEEAATQSGGAPGRPRPARPRPAGSPAVPPALVSPRPAVAHRMRRADQCAQAAPWAAALSVSRAPGYGRWVGLGVIANDLLVLGRAGPPGRRTRSR